MATKCSEARNSEEHRKNQTITRGLKLREVGLSEVGLGLVAGHGTLLNNGQSGQQ